jgi:hypothetical protein
VDGLNVAMTIMRFAKDARVVLYACVLLEAALAAEWCAVLPEPRRRELKELLLGVYDHVHKLDDKQDRESWHQRISRLQRLVEERRQGHSFDEAVAFTPSGFRGPERSQAKSHVRSSQSLPALGLQGKKLPQHGTLRRLHTASAVGIGGELDVPTGNWWRARCLEQFPGRPRPFLTTTASATFFGGSQFTVLEPRDRRRLDEQMRCTFSTF